VQRLVADGEVVLDVPPKLSTRARICDTGHGHKNDRATPAPSPSPLPSSVCGLPGCGGSRPTVTESC